MDKTLSIYCGTKIELGNVLCDFLTGTSENPCVGNCISEQIVSILFGSKKTRLGNAPTDEQRKYMLELVNYYVQRNLPIQSVTMWGALKGYGIWSDRLDADLCDAMALRRFMCIHSQITAIYKPGIQFNILSEDITEFVLAPEVPDIENRIHQYYMSLCSMIRTFGLGGYVRIVRESELLSARDVTFDGFIRQAHFNAEVLYNYWHALVQRGYQFDPNMVEYKALLAIGWQGTIPQEQWEYYIERASTEHPDWSTEQRGKAACLYLGNALGRKQVGTFKALGATPLLKVSFVPYPPGTPVAMSMGRVEYKLKDSKSSNTSTPPWAGFGSVCRKGDNWEFSVLSVRQLRERQNIEHHPVIAESEYGTCQFCSEVVLAA